MPCFPYKDEKTGIVGIFCVSGRGRKPPAMCSWCGKSRSTVLCDHPTGKGKTCDKPLCGRCAEHHGDDQDYCPNHLAIVPLPEQRSLFP